MREDIKGLTHLSYGGYFLEEKYKQDISMELDVVSSITVNLNHSIRYTQVA